MALATRFIIIAPSDRPAPPGILGELQAIIPPIQAWIASQLNGPTFTPGTFTLINSQYTAAQFHMSPPFYADKTLDEASPGDSRKAENTSTIIIINSKATDYTGWGWGWSRTSGAAIIDELILIALAGEPPPPDAPPLAAQYWPNSLTGMLTHEMIHSWGVPTHNPGIMTEFWLYPNTFISMEDKAILLGSPFISEGLSPYWIPLTLEQTCIPGGFKVYVESDTLTTLQMVYSYQPPKSRRTYKVQRGERVFCYYTWKLIDPIVINQEEPFNTHEHTFNLIPIIGCWPVYFYIRHRFIAEKTSSKTPIISGHCYLPDTWTENFPGPHYDLPWTNTSSPGLPPPTPQAGLLTLYAPTGPWRHEILLLGSDLPPLSTLPISNLSLTIHATTSSVGGKLAHTYCKATYWNPETGQGTYRTIYFAHETQDCTGSDPLWHDPGIGAWRAPNNFSDRNLGKLYTNPPDFCWPVYDIPMKNLLSLRLGARASGWGSATITFDFLRILYQDPISRPTRYEPTHPG